MDSNQDQGVVENTDIASQQAEVVQPEPTPSSEQTQQTEKSPEQVATDTADTQPENPRTAERMQELLAENKRLKSQQIEKTYGTSVFDSFQPQVGQTPTAPTQPNIAQPDVNQFVQADGTVDINGFNQAINLAQRQAQAAMQESRQTKEQIARLEESQQAREAHQAHPWLDPQSDSFDPKGFELVRDKLLSSMVFGRKLNLLDAASEVSKIYKPQTTVDVVKVEQKAVEDFKKNQQAKQQQGPIEPGGGQPRQSSDTDLAELKARTRKGDTDAIMERMKGIGLVKN